ncbi:hypothetical protein FDP41_013619 [Naegleria fowleri]|uniref:Uncharacterized protein n=1 Tax=Naegleria fowleri TaxID=5763 RepID=A0A6A5C4K6_NAEFO|nr:uncharacterized protein FDP41_013619 [Naegleria fowleri]KAF0980405.1 hypothetical protein FDP41_013619 [Naegleria fowleri]
MLRNLSIVQHDSPLIHLSSALFQRASNMILQYPSLLPPHSFLFNPFLIHTDNKLFQRLSNHSLLSLSLFKSIGTCRAKFSMSTHSFDGITAANASIKEDSIQTNTRKKYLKWKFILLSCAVPAVICILYSGMKMVKIWKHNVSNALLIEEDSAMHTTSAMSQKLISNSIKHMPMKEHDELSEGQNYSLVKGLLFDVLKFPVTCCLVGLNIVILLVFR